MPSPRALLTVVAAAAALGVAGGAGLHAIRPSRHRPALALPELYGQAVWAAGRRPAPAFALRDQDGRVVSLAGLRGRTVALTFLSAHCRGACPVLGRRVGQIVRRLSPAERPRLVVVDVDPWDDSPVTARAVVRRWHLGAGTSWLLGSRRELASVWRAYGIAVEPRVGDVVHGLAVYLIDRHGFERTGYLFPFQPAFVEGDLRRLAEGTAA